MSGARIKSDFGMDSITRSLEDEHEHRIASKVQRGECLTYTEESRARAVLDRNDLHEFIDYRRERCFDEDEDEDY